MVILLKMFCHCIRNTVDIPEILISLLSLWNVQYPCSGFLFPCCQYSWIWDSHMVMLSHLLLRFIEQLSGKLMDFFYFCFCFIIAHVQDITTSFCNLSDSQLWYDVAQIDWGGWGSLLRYFYRVKLFVYSNAFPLWCNYWLSNQFLL